MNNEMVQGYFDGRNPEPSSNRTRSYRHGFWSGRADLGHRRQAAFQEIERVAQEAHDADMRDGLVIPEITHHEAPQGD